MRSAMYTGLPAGIGPEPSPLFNLADNPFALYRHLVRYMLVTEHLFKALLTANPSPCRLRILDVGCGYAEMYAFISKYKRPRGYSVRYNAIDGDPNRLAYANLRFPRLKARQVLLPEGLQDINGAYQGVICSEVYEHLTAAQGLTLLFWLHKLTLPNGVAVFTIPTPLHSRYRSNPLHLNEILPADFIAAAEAIGWKVTKWFWLSRETHVAYANVPSYLSSPLVAPGLKPATGHQALYILTK